MSRGSSVRGRQSSVSWLGVERDSGRGAEPGGGRGNVCDRNVRRIALEVCVYCFCLLLRLFLGVSLKTSFFFERIMSFSGYVRVDAEA